MNIFVHTNSPQVTFGKAIAMIPEPDGLKAGYRDFDQDECVTIYTAGRKEFSVR